MVVIDAVMRLIPGVLGDAESAEDESFGPEGGLEYPHYTRPREYRGRAVPEILLGGDHAAIDRWRRAQARARTIDRRGDLIASKPSTEPKSSTHPTIEHAERHEPPGEPGEPDRAERMG